MRKIILKEECWGKNEYSKLTAELNDKDNLIFSEVDSGDSIKKQYDDFDYEYWCTVKSEYISTILLHLLQEKFSDISKIRKWLEEKNIPFENSSF